MSKRKKIITFLVCILLLIGISWWAFGKGDDAQVKKVQQMGQEMFSQGKRPDPAKFEAFRKEVDKLTPAQRQKLDGGPRQEMERRMQKEMDDYFALPKEQRAAFLDKRIKQMEEWHKQMASGKPPGDKPPGDKPPDGKGMAGPPPGGPGGPGGRPGGPGSPTAEQRRQFRTGMLDHSTPQDRAKRSAFMADMMKRRVALGLSPMPTPPGRPPR